MDNKKVNENEQSEPKKNKGDDIMSAVARNYVYEVKVKTDNKCEEKVVSKEFLEACKKVAAKYPKR
ncbi:hypothetical protein [Konateibacter massiliensis]|uniref:hypothetical protein n=1 Tax=Konateibacter massiliensis TaxID=2002841 RepID=UPI000C150CFD|nr:hypothetical protein [Konateibacter massiliensis]